MTGIKVRSGGVTKDPANIRIRWGGVTKIPSKIYVRSGGAWVLVYPRTAAPMINGATGGSFGNGSVDHGFSCTVIGGVGPFTYQWSLSGQVRSALTGGTTGSGVLVRSTATNQEAWGTLRVTVTDTGNGNAVTFAETSYAYQHGTPV